MTFDDKTIAELKEKALQATPGPWVVDTIHKDCEFDSYSVFAGDKTLFDTFNSDAAEVHEERDEEDFHAWDEIGRRNTEFVAAANPSAILSLIAHIEELQAERELLVKKALEAAAEAVRDRAVLDEIFVENAVDAILSLSHSTILKGE